MNNHEYKAFSGRHKGIWSPLRTNFYLWLNNIQSKLLFAILLYFRLRGHDSCLEVILDTLNKDDVINLKDHKGRYI